MIPELKELLRISHETAEQHELARRVTKYSDGMTGTLIYRICQEFISYSYKRGQGQRRACAQVIIRIQQKPDYPSISLTSLPFRGLLLKNAKEVDYSIDDLGINRQPHNMVNQEFILIFLITENHHYKLEIRNRQYEKDRVANVRTGPRGNCHSRS